MSATEIRVGDYIRLRSQWVSANVGYSLPNMTLIDWERYGRTPQGQLHRQNREKLQDEFDAAVWPIVLDAAQSLIRTGDPLPVPDEWQKSEKEEAADRKAMQRAALSAFSPKRRRR